ncbi:TetR/AcrR family transcriptional regulator [Mycolicibacterium iranicum]|uniref:TetR family transcriptional regulator n=1 Tax=Mycolicibacterium iranicum TaxID=912594 RepID=A0A178M177_MYCIR|nr:TetR/AcrR family transcriptional regulator [Mycolicibacterium iranicum]OAN41498.1 TetR family transcriptional regulator [Mycolicibacterium iranicum]
MTAPVAPRTRTRLPAADRRRQILTAAGTLIAQRGYFGLSVQDVAHVCGLTVPGVLHHFPSKDDLLLAVLEHRDTEDAAALAAQFGATLEPTALDGAQAHNVCAAIMERNAQQPELIRLFVVLGAEALTPDHPAHDFFKARRRRTLQLFSAAFSTLAADPQALARHVVALMDGLQLQWLEAEGEIDLAAEWLRVSSNLFGHD